MPVNHAKEFLKFIYNEALFSQLFARALIQLCSLNFKAKFLKTASINSEFLNVSMVEPAPESPARWLVYCGYVVKFFRNVQCILRLMVFSELSDRYMVPISKVHLTVSH